jgi:hypothetical protein
MAGEWKAERAMNGDSFKTIHDVEIGMYVSVRDRNAIRHGYVGRIADDLDQVWIGERGSSGRDGPHHLSNVRRAF